MMETPLTTLGSYGPVVLTATVGLATLLDATGALDRLFQETDFLSERAERNVLAVVRFVARFSLLREGKL